ncbi:MAG: AMP-binding protein [Alphaproteobacteria bacterium]|nr:AMP-binding protein [Alphaproteobacteria bacterium]
MTTATVSSIYTPAFLSQTYTPGVNWDLDIPEHPIQQFVDDAAKRFGRAEGFNFKGKTYSWRKLARMSDRIAEGLQERGLQKGERVALMLPNTFEYAALYYGVLKAGGIVVNVNPMYPEDQIEHFVKDSGAKFIATLDIKPFFGKARAAMKALGHQVEDLIVCPMDQALPLGLKVAFNTLKRAEVDPRAYNMGYRMFADFRSFRGRYKKVAIDPKNDVAVLQYTGGTTGLPKAAMLSHYNVASIAHQARAWMPDAKEGIGASLAVIPFFHVFSMSAILNLSVRMGWTIHAMPKPDLAEAGKLIQKHRITFLGGVPTLFQGLVRSFKGRIDSLERSISGGAPLPADVKGEFETKSGARVWEGFGMTEMPVATCQPSHVSGAAGNVGIPFPRNEVRIVSPEDGVTDMPVGEAGEIILRGPARMLGYWNNEAETAKTIRDGWLYTGDLGTADANGVITIVGRSKDLIIVNGYNVYPKKAEGILDETGKFAEVMVFGVKDKRSGEAPIVLVRPKDGVEVNAQEIHRLLRSKLSRSDWPREVIVTSDELPKTEGIAKLAKRLAQDKYNAGHYEGMAVRFKAGDAPVPTV